MTDRRAFLHSIAAGAATAALPTFNAGAIRRLTDANEIAAARPALSLAEDEAYWGTIQRAFDLDRTMTNLNNGGCSPTPTHVLEQMVRDLRFSNELPVDHMWRTLEPRIESVRRDLASDFGCDPEEMAITRNASESLENMIFGLDLKRGDEAILTTQNYPRMITSWKQRERRDGVVIKWIKLDTPPKSDEDTVARFAEAITPRTKIIEVMHVSFQTGYIAPVRKIVDMARPRGVQVLVDGAHAYGQFPFTRDELGCDYYGTSLHKWLMAPIGTGFMYVRKDRIKALWPLMAAGEDLDNNIRKFEEIGTHPAANHNAISVALAFHRAIGAERKIARLRYLRNRWADRLLKEGNGRVKMFTKIGPNESGAIAVVGVEGLELGALNGWLYNKYRIVATGISNAEFSGLRVTPSVYTTVDEVDRFAEAVLTGIRNGIKS
jgi:isopenicillin-N epimerase